MSNVKKKKLPDVRKPIVLNKNRTNGKEVEALFCKEEWKDITRNL